MVTFTFGVVFMLPSSSASMEAKMEDQTEAGSLVSVVPVSRSATGRLGDGDPHFVTLPCPLVTETSLGLI
jgi:hypothetical protein